MKCGDGVLKRDDAVSELLSLILILGIIFVISGTAAAVFLPGYAAEKESEHQTLLEDEFSSLKTGIDILWLTGTYGAEKTVLFSLSADHTASGKLWAGSTPLEISADDGVFSLPVLDVVYTKSGTMQYRYLGGTLYKGDDILLSASESSSHSVLICTESPAPFSLYAAEPVPVACSLQKKAEYHNVSCGEKHTDLLTVYFVSVDGGVR